MLLTSLNNGWKCSKNDTKLAKVLKTRVIGDKAKRTRAYATVDQIKKEHDL